MPPSDETAKEVREACSDALKAFLATLPPQPPQPPLLTEERIRAVIREEADKLFETHMQRLGLPCDKEHIDETGEAVRRLLRMQKTTDKVAGHVFVAFMTSLFFGILALLGYKGISSH